MIKKYLKHIILIFIIIILYISFIGSNFTLGFFIPGLENAVISIPPDTLKNDAPEVHLEPPTPLIEVPIEKIDDVEEIVETKIPIIDFPHYRWVYGNVYEVNPNTTEAINLKQIAEKQPIPGIIVNNSTVTDNNGYYRIDAPYEYASTENLDFVYGDISAAGQVPGLTASDILKYNGYDYIGHKSETTTSTEIKTVIEHEIKYSKKGAAQIYLLLDASYSMATTKIDYHGTLKTRLEIAVESAKFLIDNLLNDGNNVYIGIICYAGESYRVASLTKDRYFLKQVLDNIVDLNIAKNSYIAGGTDLIKAIEKAEESFFVDKSDPDWIDKTNRNIIMLSDGFPTADHKNNLVLVTNDSLETLQRNLIKIIENTQEKIISTITEEHINFMTLIVNPETDFNPIVDILFEVTEFYKRFNSESDLADFIKNNLKEWVLKQLTPVTEFSTEDITMTANEDPTRRKEVDDQFRHMFYYNKIEENESSTPLSQRLKLFNQAIEEIDGTPEEIKQAQQILSDKTKMLIRGNPVTFSNIVKDDNDHHVTEYYKKIYETEYYDEIEKDENGNEKVVTKSREVHVRTERHYETGIMVDIALQRRDESALYTNVTATGMKIVLNEGTVLSEIERPRGDKRPLLEVVDDDITHGATVLVEYTVTVKNNSDMQYTSLMLVDYLPKFFMYSENTQLLSDLRLTNKDNGWTSCNIDYLLDKGYINQKTFDKYSVDQSTALLYSISNSNLGQEGFFLGSGQSLTTKFVVSRVISKSDVGSADDITGIIQNDCEVLGYGFDNGMPTYATRRMNVVTTENSKVKLTGVYPGDMKIYDLCNELGFDPNTVDKSLLTIGQTALTGVDYAQSSNSVFLVPPTGKVEKVIDKYYKYIIIGSTITSFFLILGIYLKKRKK